MNSYYFVVNILLCILVMAKCVEEDDLKDELVEDILHFVDADAYTHIDISMNKYLGTDFKFQDRKSRHEVRDHLKMQTISNLESMKSRALTCIHCTFAFAAKRMIKYFKIFVERMDDANKKNDNLLPFGIAASASKITWRKAISAIVSIGVKPGSWLWQMLIFTNTIQDVVANNYPGMTGNQDVFERIKNVVERLLNVLEEVGFNCLLPGETEWDFNMPDNDITIYDKNLFKAKHLPCPKSLTASIEMQQLCKHFEYIENFDKLLFRNQMKLKFSYDKHENYDPYRWLVTYPSLKRTIIDGLIPNSDLEAIENKLNEYVQPISNQDWVLRYSSEYFETVRNMSEVVLQTSLQLLIRNFILCKHYWESIQIVIGDQKQPFDFKNECTGIQASIEMIMKKFNLNENEILQTLHKLSGNVFTSNIEYHLIVNYIDPKFNTDEFKINDDPPTIEISKSYNEEFKTYSNELPEANTEEFALFKKSLHDNKFSCTVVYQ